MPVTLPRRSGRASGGLRAFAGKKTPSLWIYILFGLGEVAAFCVVAIGIIGPFAKAFPDWTGVIAITGMTLAIAAVVVIDHLCAYKTGRCWIPYRNGCPK